MTSKYDIIGLLWSTGCFIKFVKCGVENVIQNLDSFGHDSGGVCFGRFDADLDGDKYVGIDDLATIAYYWLDDDNPACNGDTGSDCQVDMADFSKLAEQWQWMECVSSAAASSVENSSYGPSNAIDGSMDTRWSSAFDDNQWIQIDLGQIRNIYGMTIYWEDAYARVYNVQVSEDAGTWTTVYSTSNSNGGTDDINFPEQTMMFIRINCITRSTPYGSSIYEIELKSDDNCQGSSASWELVWSDEFDGTSLNGSNWSYDIGNGNGGWGNNELEYYRSQNVSVSGGYLTIEAREESYAGYDYTSGKIHSRNKQDFLYGKIEARMKLPTGQGIWPAFWMMPTDSVYGGWPLSGEIDIMEMINEATTVYGTLHFGQSYPNNQQTGASYSPGVDLSQGFHTYTLEWGPAVMRWYVDDVLFSTKTNDLWWTISAPDNPLAPFDQSFYLILNLAVGGNWPGYPDATTVFPQQYVIDYVRVYELQP